MNNFVDIVMPAESADGYYMSRQKSKVDDFIYIDEEWYSKLLDSNTFYILGPKGSGKTLYAAYMCAEKRGNIVSRSHTIDVGDYGKLIAMTAFIWSMCTMDVSRHQGQISLVDLKITPMVNKKNADCSMLESRELKTN